MSGSPHNTFTSTNYGGRNMNGQVTGGTFVQGDCYNDSRDTHNTYNNQNNQGKMVGGPVYGGTVNCADTNNNSQNMKNTGHLNYVSGTVSVGGNVNQMSGASGGDDTESDESKEDPELQKAFEEFLKKFYAEGAIADKLSREPYPMARKGKMLIINNEIWPNNPGCDRKGTDKDRKALIDLSKYIGFEAVVKDNLTVKEMKKVLKEFAAKQVWKDFDAAIVCILSHGGENNSIYGTGNLEDKLEFPELLEPFSQQTDLHEKPKIFIVQACRGDNYDNQVASGDKIEFAPVKKLFSSIYGKLRGVLPSGTSKPDSKYESQVADVLILWATGWGFVAWRHPLFGSYFIRQLTNAIKDEDNKKEHMAEIMEQVIHEIKKQFQAGPPDIYHPGQCPQAFTTLDRKLYLM
uniref:Caspase n=1 Tax=Plectus sambesii TaxID=2011161 RepID=A0A914WI43_9BILA